VEPGLSRRRARPQTAASSAADSPPSTTANSHHGSSGRQPGRLRTRRATTPKPAVSSASHSPRRTDLQDPTRRGQGGQRCADTRRGQTGHRHTDRGRVDTTRRADALHELNAVRTPRTRARDARMPDTPDTGHRTPDTGRGDVTCADADRGGGQDDDGTADARTSWTTATSRPPLGRRTVDLCTVHAALGNHDGSPVRTPAGAKLLTPRSGNCSATPPAKPRLGALLSCVGFGWYEGRAMGQRRGEVCGVRLVREC
jgi:hypothetical protein